MKLNIKKSFWYVLGLVTVIYLVISLAIPFNKTATYWLAFAFGLIALAAQIIFFRNAFDGAEKVISKLYGFPIARVGLIYLVVQVAISFIIMTFAASCPLWVSVLLGIVLAALAGIGLTGTVVSRKAVEKREAQIVSDKTDIMKQLRAEAESFAKFAPEELRVEAGKLAEAIRYSDPVTTDALQETDTALLVVMRELQVNSNADSVLAFSKKLEERNIRCKALK
ncbi:MAG: hypothetical protein ACK5LL_02115 [Suipraeoptans sp.]